MGGPGPGYLGSALASMWVTEHARIAAHYLRTWFVLDFSTIALPCTFDVLSVTTDTSESAFLSTGPTLRVLRVLRLVKLVRLVRAARPHIFIIVPSDDVR